MNSSQRNVIIVGVMALFLMGLIPPWIQVLDLEGLYRELPLGYEPIFSPPRPTRLQASLNSASYVSLDVTRLAVQWITVCLVVGLLSLALRTTERKERE